MFNFGGSINQYKFMAMKKIILYSLIAFALCLTSCVSYPEHRQYVGMINYSEFDRQGLFVTESNSVNFAYTPIGSIIVEDIGGMAPGKATVEVSNGGGDDLYSGTKRRNKYISPDHGRAVALAIKALKNVGATGMINMRIQFSMEYSPIERVSVGKITITGMAIK